MDTGDRRSGNFDDLFEDLDRFFNQSGEDSEAGDEGGRSREGHQGSEPVDWSTDDPSDDRPGGPADEHPRPSDPGSSGSDNEDILPSGWLADVEGLDEQAAPVQPPSERHRPTPEPAGWDGTGANRLDDTAEMAAEDWTRLREALGAEGAGQESSTAGPEPEERGELTLEDLKKAPPEYRDLPMADEDTGDTAEPGAAVPGAEDEEDAGAESVPGPPPEEEPDAFPWDEPAIADVEMAADQVAEEFAPGEGEDEMAEEADLLSDLTGPAAPPPSVGAEESMAGPSWEEPASRPMIPEPAEPMGVGTRNVPAALLTAVALAAAALISLAVAKAAFAVVAGAIVLLGQAELYATMQRRGSQPATALGLVVGGFVLAGAYLRGEPAMMMFLAVGLAATLLWFMAVPAKAREGALGNVGVTMLGIVYVPFLAGYLLLLLAQAQSGRALMLSVLGLTFLYDAAAFFFGSFWGNRPLAHTISPKKSWEGLFGATVVTFAVAIAVLPEISPFDPSVARAVGMALIVSIFAPLGDLAESLLKRDLGVKDMGSFLPGHGGALDRIDSALFVGMAAFYFVRVFF
jgi:phosphatidate cytidylyltransferase